MFTFSKPQDNIVSLAFSADFTKLELVWLNTQSGQIVNAGFVPITSVEVVTRSILFPDSLLECTQTLIQKMDIPKGVPITVMLPSFYTRMLNLPTGVPEADLNSIVLGEAERSVLFKKEEPTVDWVYLGDASTEEDNQYCIYTAYPVSALTEKLGLLRSLGLNIHSVETNVTATINGLVTTGTLQNDTQKRVLVIINESNASIILLNGIQLVSLVEAPIPVQNLSPKDVLTDLQQDILGMGDLLEGCNTAIIIHNNTKIPTELFSTTFESFDEVVLVEQNHQTIASLGAKKALYPCTVEALGACMLQEMKQLPTLNLLPQEDQINILVQGVRTKILPFSIATNILVLALVLGSYGVLSIFNVTAGLELSNLEKEMASHAKPTIPPETYAEGLWIHRYRQYNIGIVNWLLSIQQELPSTLWLDKLSLQTVNGKTMIQLSGGSQSGKELASYFEKIQPSFMPEKLLNSQVIPTPLALKPSLAVGTNTSSELSTSTKPNVGAELDKATDSNLFYKWQVKAGQEATVDPAAAAVAPPPPPAPPA